jgi:hypothetical protein
MLTSHRSVVRQALSLGTKLVVPAPPPVLSFGLRCRGKRFQLVGSRFRALLMAQKRALACLCLGLGLTYDSTISNSTPAATAATTRR